MKLNKFKLILGPTEYYSIFIISIYTLLAIIFFNKVNYSGALIISNFIVATMLLLSSYYFNFKNPESKFQIFAKILYAPVVYYCYLQVQSYIWIVNPNDFDSLLINIDKFLLGFNPTEELMKISNPYLTEYLQFAYFTFFFMPIIHAIELKYRNKINEFNEFTYIMPFAFYFSFLAYFMLPAIGPRFTLHDFANTSVELPGIFLTEFFREIVNSGGGIPKNSTNPQIFVNRDCFPSGHTMMTLLNMFLAIKYKSKLRHIILIIGFSLIFSTIYLRYHYFIDIVFGFVFFILTLIIEPRIRKYILKSNNVSV